ncbi:MAG: asparaginase, partial [Burkholderiales bacterium]|nr:asparaginase [Burkholderiales bacterium]
MSEGSVVPLVVVERGGRVESVHHGAIAVTDATGRLIASAGSPGLATFTRSALKPFQALPFVLAGGPSRFGLSQQQVALLCASHSGEVRHQV